MAFAMEEMEDDAMRGVNVQHLIARRADSGPRHMGGSWQELSEKSMAAITGAGSGDDGNDSEDMDLSDAMRDFQEIFWRIESEVVEDEEPGVAPGPLQFRTTVNDLHGELLVLEEGQWIVLESFKVPRSYFDYMGLERYGWELEYAKPEKETIDEDIRFRYRTGVDGRPVKLEFLIEQSSGELRDDPPLVDYELHFEGGKIIMRGRSWVIRSAQIAFWQYAD